MMLTGSRSGARMTTVSVRLFAGLHQLIGERVLEMRLPDGATVGQLRDALGAQYPVVQALLPTLVCAVDEDYVTPDHVLRDGDHVALIPPVSGGADAGAAGRCIAETSNAARGRGETRPYAAGRRGGEMPGADAGAQPCAPAGIVSDGRRGARFTEAG
jgi:molybdopterin converting factor subunit 1